MAGLGLELRLLDPKACSQPPTHSFVVAVDFRILGQPWTRCGRETDCGWVVTADLSATFASRLRWKHTSSLKVANEPILAFTQGSPEREALQKVREGRAPAVGTGHGWRHPSAAPACFSVPMTVTHCQFQPWEEAQRLGRGWEQQGDNQGLFGTLVQVRGHKPTDVLCF